MIRVLQVVRIMNRGGIESFLMNVYRNINREEIQFDFLIQSETKGAFDDEIMKLGGKLYHIPYLTDCGYYRYCDYLYRFFIQHSDYKIVHSHMNSVSGPILKMARKAGIEGRIAHAHIGKLEGNFKQRLVRRILQFSIPNDATYLLGCSELAARCIFGKKAHKAIIIHNAIDLEKFVYREALRNQMRKSMQIENKFVIGHIGRFVEQKNHTFLIDIFYELQKIKEECILLLIGDGILVEAIKKKVDSLGINEKVLFLGVRSDISELMQAMDVFLFPSLFEGLPVTLIEAQAAGLRSFVSDQISDEVCITNNIQMLSLDQPAKMWAEQLNNCNYNRMDTSDFVKKAGYDIIKSTNELVHLYYNSIEN